MGHLEEDTVKNAHPVYVNAGKRLGSRKLERFPQQLPQNRLLLASTCSEGAHMVVPTYDGINDANAWHRGR